MNTELTRWLVLHPDAWHGWPSHKVLEYDEVARLIQRLKVAKFPLRLDAQAVADVSDVVAQLRIVRRSRYVSEIRSLAL